MLRAQRLSPNDLIEQALRRLPKHRLSETDAQTIRVFLRESGRFVAFHRRFVDVIADTSGNQPKNRGNTKAALLLSQAIYWLKHGTEIEAQGGWFSKTAEQWEIETGLSRREVDTARRRLREIGLLEEKKIGLPAMPYYRINVERLGELLANRIGRTLPQSLSVQVLRQCKDEWVRQLMGPVIAYNRMLAAVCDSVNAALYLSNAIASQSSAMSVDARGQGWYLRPTNQVTLETGLTRHQQVTARRILRDKGFLVEGIAGVPPRRFSFVDLRKLQQVVSKSKVSFKPTKATPPAIQPKAPVIPLPLTQKIELENHEDKLNPSLALFGKTDWRESEERDGANRKISNMGLEITSVKENTPPPLPPVASAECTGPVMQRGGGRHEISAEQIDWSSLIFPRWLAAEDTAACKTALLRAPRGEWQILLDELSGQKTNPNRRRPIENPVAYLRSIATQAKLGGFTPELAHKVAKSRREVALREKAFAEAERLATEKITARIKRETHDDDGQSTAQQAEIAKMRAMLKRAGVNPTGIG
jgi:hypothetical protein